MLKHALSQRPINTEPIWPLVCPGYNPLTQMCLGSVFAPLQVSAGADFGSLLLKSPCSSNLPHKSEYSGLFRPLSHNLSVSHGSLSRDYWLTPFPLKP